MTADKIAEGAKQISVKTGTAMGKAALCLGAGDALMLAGFTFLGIACWLRSQAFRFRNEVPHADREKIFAYGRKDQAAHFGKAS